MIPEFSICEGPNGFGKYNNRLVGHAVFGSVEAAVYSSKSPSWDIYNWYVEPPTKILIPGGLT